jgi:hypothetical protein
MMTEGRATIWICWSTDITDTEQGCGFIGLYKPESEWSETNQGGVAIRRCPGCGGLVTYHKAEGELAIVQVKST